MKINKLFIIFSAALIFSLPLQSSNAEDNVYGWEMMTEQERTQHSETMRNFNTNEERERYRLEHHKRMQERAKERGLSMPDMPQNRMRGGSGTGMGSGSGGGKGR